MHSISTSASFGSLATSTALRAGQAPSKNVAYTPFMAAKLFMSLRKTVVLMTFSMAAPAAAERATGYVVGGISPLGRILRIVPKPIATVKLQ